MKTGVKKTKLALFGNKTIPEEENTIQAERVDLLEQTEKTNKIGKENSKNKNEKNTDNESFKNKNQKDVNLSVDINSQLGSKIKNINDKIEEEIERVKRHTLNNSQNKDKYNNENSGKIIVSKSIDSPINDKLNKLEKELTQKKFDEIMNKSRSKDASINNISKNHSNNREEYNNQTEEQIIEGEDQEDFYESRIRKTKESENFLTKEKIEKSKAKSKSSSKNENSEKNKKVNEDIDLKNELNDVEEDLELDDAADILQSFIMFVFDKKTQLQLENNEIETHLYFHESKNSEGSKQMGSSSDKKYSEIEDVDKKYYDAKNKFNNFEIDSNNFSNNEDRPLNMNELNNTKITNTVSKNTENMNNKHLDAADIGENSADLLIKSETLSKP